MNQSVPRPLEPPFDGSPACPACPAAVRALSALVRNYLARSDVWTPELAKAVLLLSSDSDPALVRLNDAVSRLVLDAARAELRAALTAWEPRLDQHFAHLSHSHGTPNV